MLASIFVRSRPQLEAILGPKLGPSRPPKSPTSRPGRLPRRAWEPESAKTTPQDAPRPSKTPPRPPKLLQNASPTPLKEALIFDSFRGSCAFENCQICSHRIDAWKYINPADDFKFRQGVGGMGEAFLDPPDHLGESRACSRPITSPFFFEDPSKRRIRPGPPAAAAGPLQRA